MTFIHGCTGASAGPGAGAGSGPCEGPGAGPGSGPCVGPGTGAGAGPGGPKIALALGRNCGSTMVLGVRYSS